MKILLTGSSGFIGSHLTPRLEKNFELYHLKNDLLDFDAVAKEVYEISPNIVVHLAARTEVEKSFYEQITFSQINYTGSVNLIEAAAKLDNPCYFVFASTMEVYGWQPVSDEIKDGKIPDVLPVFDETTEVHPNAPYAVAKYGVEKYLEYAQRAYNLDYAIIRQTNSYGRKDNNFFVTEQIIWQMLQGNTCNLGYGEPFRNFIYIDDLLDAWETVIVNQNKCRNNLFTIGPANALQITEHAKNIAELLNWQGTINWNTKSKRHGEIYLLNSNNKKLSQLTGWSPKVSYNDGLQATIDFWNRM
jgi:GDP-4-dehydro-6-deoxy-D-mannose reductase